MRNDRYIVAVKITFFYCTFFCTRYTTFTNPTPFAGNSEHWKIRQKKMENKIDAKDLSSLPDELRSRSSCRFVCWFNVARYDRIERCLFILCVVVCRNRYKLLSKKFDSIFNEKPTFYARAPGRVNLIGINICVHLLAPSNTCCYYINSMRSATPRRAYWLLWLQRVADGHRTRRCACRLAQLQLGTCHNQLRGGLLVFFLFFLQI